MTSKTKNCKECGVEFTATGSGAHFRLYCADHFKGDTSYRAKLNGTPPEEQPLRKCSHCTNKISPLKAEAIKYCSKGCQKKASRARRTEADARERDFLMAAEGSDPRNGQHRRGPIYKKLKTRPDLVNGWRNGRFTITYVAAELGYSVGGTSRALTAILADLVWEERNVDWSPSWRVKAMLPSYSMIVVKRMGMDGQADTPEFNALVDELVHAYSVFSRYYFNLEGKRPLVKDFHLKWIRSIIVAYATGGKQLILSPPRHGKSEMMIRFVVWFIVMDPNIRIGWFCASSDVAKIMVGAVKDIFENDKRLIADTLPPGDLYDPGLKSSNPWSAKEIKVAQQSHVGAKSSSMIGLGRTSKFLSRDMDIIVIDDMEDYDSCREEGQRIYSRNKLAEIGTRKVEETAEIAIGSRQHPDDIPNHLLDLEGSILQWKVIVDSAHDPECDIDPEEYEKHIDCMLFPEVRSYRYLMEKKLEMEVLGLGHLYPLRYLNHAIPEEGQVFDLEQIREKALNRERGLGLEGLPLGRLVAGLDPSARGIQAAFCWHYRDEKLSMVDLDATQSGGMAGAHAIMRLWHDQYGLTDWFYEDNAQQVEFFNDPRTKALALELGLNIKPYTTGMNKQDPEFGISSMAPWYHDGRIDLPYGTRHAIKKVNLLLRQLELWTVSGVLNRKSKTDIKMASWFPFPTIVKWLKQDRDVGMRVSSEASYPGIDSFETAPWGSSAYPSGGR